MAADDRPRRRLRAVGGSIRWRVTLAAVVVVGLALAAGAVGMITLLHRAEEDNVRTAARLRANEIAAVIESGQTPGTLAVDDEEEVLIQVLDAAGKVVASSPNMAGRPPVADVRPGQAKRIEETPIEDEASVVVGRAARAPSGTFTVLVARTLSDSSAEDVAELLRIGLPLLLVLVGFTTWWAVGRALIPTLGRLEESQARQRRFVADASHELRSPLANLRQPAEVALAHPERADAAKLARTVLTEGARMQRLVEDLLLLARADEGTSPVRRTPVDLDDVVFEVAAGLRQGSTLRVDTTAVSAGRVAGDQSQLQRMVQNLADNAARHAKSAVGFGLREDSSGSTQLCVEDDGPGIAEADRQRIFERFVRLDGARARDAGGSGLGLAIVAEIVAAHGGTISVGTSPLGGARFEVLLPRHA
ncbi:MAG TPA: HAMP domain-containing sensor histidine kinase [Acidimicrobiia bacterium]|nr:HAMP domain-containing sensor histidine kinase [Acidimicrobiia bacterium]